MEPSTQRTGTSPPIEVRLAASELERRAAYRLRYEVYTQEAGEERYANHAAGEYKDVVDELGNAHLYVAVANNQIVGTLRITYRTEMPFIADERYCWHTLGEKCALTTSEVQQEAVLLDRGAVQRDYRRLGCFTSLWSVVRNDSLREGRHVFLVVVHSLNLASQQFFERHGFVRHIEDHQEGCSHIVYYLDTRRS